MQYNRAPRDNPFGLLPAWQLYQNKTYESLVDRFGRPNVFILSAGWGLIKADFLTPCYDITFSQSAENYKRRRRSDRYDDFMMLTEKADDEVVFSGGKDYLPLFCALTGGIKARKTVFYNAAQVPQVTGCTLERFVTRTRTNWHYECANAFLDRPHGNG